MFFFFFFNDTATTEIYTLSLHDALPISRILHAGIRFEFISRHDWAGADEFNRSEEHTSELQSLAYLVCRLLLEKKKITALLQPAPRHTDRPAPHRPRPAPGHGPAPAPLA